MFAVTRGPPRCWLKTSGAGPKYHDGRCTSGGVTPLALAPPPPTTGPPPAPRRACTSDAGCSLCGSCDVATGTCRCDRGFAGANCEVLNMGGALKCGEGGLCMVGERVGSNSGVEPTTGYATWGGSVVSNPDFSEFHM